MKQRHAPTPYRAEHCPDNGGSLELYGKEGECIATLRNGNKEENAAFIARACNAHDELVEILQEIIEPPPQGWDLIVAASLMDKARNALTKARGEV